MVAKREPKKVGKVREVLDLRGEEPSGPPDVLYVDLGDDNRAFQSRHELENFYGSGNILWSMGVYKLDRVVDIQI